MRLSVNPTRMEMLKLRKRLAVARRGHKLLKDKLDGLMKDFTEIAQEYKTARLAVDDALPDILKRFVLADATSPNMVTEDALDNVRQDLDITLREQAVMSVKIPKLQVEFGEAHGGYSRVFTSPELDSAITGLKEFMPQLLRMAELEETLRRMCREIEKTRRRVNALEHTFIPRMLETIRFIKNKLDEMERSNTSRLMKIKEQRLAQDAMD